MNFDDLGLSEKVLAAVTAAGYTTPTPIQEQAIPHVLARKDVLGIAQTGTGKTAAFTLPMLTMLEQGRPRARMPRTLILEPTRELAAQVEENFVKYGVNHKLNVALLIGGMSFGDQDSKIARGVDVLIATPGRLLDHFERGKLLMTGVELLVIDEADRMLDMGFIPDIERICKMVPFTRQTLFFTATMPPEIKRIADQFLHNPVRVEVSRPASTATTITQGLVAAGSKDFDKRETLRRVIREAQDLKNAIIFCNRKTEVANLHRSLLRHNFSVVALHGDMDQPARMRALDGFRAGDFQLLVASDVAARGLDIPDVSHVFNFDVPHHAEDYVHRIGRTGRAGRKGTAMTLVTAHDHKSVAAIEKLIGRTIDWLTEQPVDTGEEPRRERGGRSRGEHRDGEKRKPRGPARPRLETIEGDAPEKPVRAPRERAAEKPARPPRERAAAEQLEAVAAPAPAPRKRPEREERRPPAERARRPREDAAEPAVLGLGDHVPSFLLRPVRPVRA
jgi:superfamily II DNA/RNA helicase